MFSFFVSFKPSLNCQVTSYLATLKFLIKSAGFQVGAFSPCWCLLSMLVSAEKLLLILSSNITLIFIATILLKLFCSNLLHPLKFRVTHMGSSTTIFSGSIWSVFIFRFTLIPQCTHFLLLWKIVLFSHEKVVVTHFDAGRWFYAHIYAKWWPLMKKVIILRKVPVTMKSFAPPFFNHFSFNLNRKYVW